jgi:type II secretory pathway component PulM
MSIIDKSRLTIAQSVLGQWYTAKNKSDRVIISIVLVLIMASVFYLAVWQPIKHYATDQSSRYINELGLAEWIALNKMQLKASANAPANETAPSSHIARITSAANKHQLKLERLQPESDGSISVVVQEQRFERVVLWISQLETQQNLAVSRVRLDRGDRQGLVSGQVRFGV